MREWIQINLEHSEVYREYLSLFEESIQFLAGATSVSLNG